MAQPSTTTIQVEEIHCGGCEQAIRNAFGRVDGVRDVTPDQQTNQVQLSFDEAQVTEVQLRNKLADIGFDPTD